MQIAALLLFVALAAAAQAQNAPALSVRPAVPPDNSILTLLHAEEARGPSIFYTQHYRSGGREVLLRGSIYAAIADARLNGCTVHLDTLLVDHFSGKRGRRPLPETSNRYKSALDFPLSPEIADALRIVEARPAQLELGTYPTCTEQPGCRMQWLEIRAPHAELKLRRITNDVADYDGYIQDRDGAVATFRIPLSSARAGEDLIARLRQFATTCPNVAPAH